MNKMNKMNKRRFTALLTAVCMLALLAAGCGGDELPLGDGANGRQGRSGFIKEAEVITVNFERSGELIINPGQGWILYGSDISHQTRATLAHGTTGYQRFEWQTINPAEGVYNWTPVDAAIAAWRRAGKQFAFGVMAVNTSGSPRAFPQWLIDNGMAYTMGNREQHSNDLTHFIPVWNDPVYVEAVRTFARALAERYDGHPDVAFIDIRKYGNWGEMHMFPFRAHTTSLSDEEVQELFIRPYLDAFTQTQLIMCWAEPPLETTNEWVVENGIGLRRDGIMGRRDWNRGTHGESIRHAAGRTPIVWEFMGLFRNLMTQPVDPWDDERFLNSVIENKPSFIGLGKWQDDAQYMLSQRPELVREVAHLMGYHFFMSSAVYTDVMEAGGTNMITVSIENTGVTIIHTDCVIKLVLLNDADEAVASHVTGWDARSILAGETTVLQTEAAFPGAAAGEYRLAIGFYRNAGDAYPTYRIENNGRTENGHYVIGALFVKNK